MSMIKLVLVALIETLAWLRLCCPDDLEQRGSLARAAAVCAMRLLVFTAVAAILLYVALFAARGL